mgnify:CR=1 FL=1
MLSRDAAGSGKHPGFLNSADLNKRPFVVVFAATIMSFFCDICRGLAALGLAWAVWPSGLAAAEPEGIEFFENHIRPLLVQNCYKCHSQKAGKAKGELQLDTRAGLLKGGEAGPAIVPGNPRDSLLIRAVSHGDTDLQMPPKTKLPQEAIDKLTQWIAMGAPDPRDGDTADISDKHEPDLAQLTAGHWAWQSVRRDVQPPQVEPVAGADWADTAVDRFILAKLQGAGLTPSAPASRRTLVRRLHFDLIGLPPTPVDIDAFVNDTSPNAYGQLVERLLASPHFGERWARHWLDLMRYAETFGHEFDFTNQEVWRYRDYVIRAFNDDVPYDRLVKEHIAGDQIKPRFAKDGGWNESRLATAWWWLGQHCHSPVDIRAYQAEIIDNQIDVIGKAFQGMTIACARCHDHKFDAISTRDFYALYGMIESGSFSHGAVDGSAKFGDTRRALAESKKKIASALPASLLKEWKNETSTPADRPEGYQLISDIRQTRGKDWFADGEAWVGALTQPSEFTVGAKSVRPMPAGWLHSGLLGRKLQGTLRSPTFTLTENHVHLLALGSDGRINLVIDNFKIIFLL